VQRGGVVDEGLIAYGDFGEYSGCVAMQHLLEHRPDLDAVFVASDLMAMGAMQTLRDEGRQIPHDVAVVGYENSSLAHQAEVPLTSVHQPVDEMGREMVRLLVAQMRGEELPAPFVVLPTRLVRRQSA
jgi:DNA-binding LacI/PurR family transcriptional regulator